MKETSQAGDATADWLHDIGGDRASLRHTCWIASLHLAACTRWLNEAPCSIEEAASTLADVTEILRAVQSKLAGRDRVVSTAPATLPDGPFEATLLELHHRHATLAFGLAGLSQSIAAL
ncbi:hypothetical protein [Sphingomonas glacialis]|uniref:Uncharacterized protein n=1 Tax=Sphingomonas glacialis TaxID=658225 RepID=A0A502FS27_9SPHN|nr:hypothetical protein [Sphingomonas glacialis]TPG52082.1 hypothetical protein EAH76_15310 [Sphingomonas glacialis]